jgi:hypothetical protein
MKLGTPVAINACACAQVSFGFHLEALARDKVASNVSKSNDRVHREFERNLSNARKLLTSVIVTFSNSDWH